MKEDQLSPSSRVKSITLQILDELLSTEATQEVGFRLWDGTLWPDDQSRRGPTFYQSFFSRAVSYPYNQHLTTGSCGSRI
jgi:hypothetical protein